ncbi:hypothetical protein PPYR_09564 [Photinus pyralis]|uniref:Small ribosomal subunit protein uS15m n=1 Tax=Photinus pyralis TaxID=7054 RepID=A0A1Y1KUS2_PHOPY|nr:28S ribosomal protein S15, mitochondrial [Photinus pyralis]KAB0798571.1 hypothetical protein PPYR_09564 [Photinus pyralis]
MNIIRRKELSTFLIPTLLTCTRNYAFKSNLKIKWVRPEKIPCYNPAKSGDLVPMPKLDKTQLQLEFRNSQELANANDLVKKLFSLEYAPRYKTTQLYLRQLIDSTKRHNQDEGSIEAKIARWTGAIRAMQDLVEKFPHNVRLRVKLKELIDKRKKQLKYLRRWDYKKFEWLIDSLNIVYKPQPLDFQSVTRKESLRKLTDKHCEDIRSDRLKTFRKQLEAEQPKFLQEKMCTLEFIRKEQEECNVEVTVAQEEIDKVKDQLTNLHKHTPI